MKYVCFFLLFFSIIVVSQSQELELKLDVSNFGSIISLLNDSQTNSGVITFEKRFSGRTTTTIYRYEDDLTSIRVESNADSQDSEFNYEHVYFDTRSANFQLFNIRVGTSINDVIRLLGTPLKRSNTQLEYTTAGYFLVFYITNNRVSRIIYNPYS
jgi:hypothetical protein